MNLEVLNGVISPTSFAPGMQGNTARIQGNTARIQGNTARIQGMSADDLREYYIAKAMGDMEAMQGTPLGFLKKARARRAEKKAARGARKETRRAQRDIRRAARTERAAKGEGFFQKAAGALSNFGEAAKIASEAQALAAQDGVMIDVMPDEVRAMAVENEPQPTFFEQYKTPLLIGGGLIVAGGLYWAMKPKKKGRKR